MAKMLDVYKRQVQITGEVRLRDESTYNPALPTGEVELAVSHMEVLSTADTLPFSLTDEEPVREEVRLKYRYLDLRRPQMYRNLLFRHTLLSEVQRLLNDQGFLQVETPILCKSTPEGARDYPVSYTHLDVYKRQGWRYAPPPRSA